MFTEIKETVSTLAELSKGYETLSNRELNKSLGERSMGMIPRNGGEWSGEPGNSTWVPDREVSPSDRNYSNTEGKTWGEILDEYEIDGIPFNDGEPDFSEVSKGTVEIDEFSDARYGAGGNFDQADEKLAQQRGCSKEEVRQKKTENNYTKKEKRDWKTINKVPLEINVNFSHINNIKKMRNQ